MRRRQVLLGSLLLVLLAGTVAVLALAVAFDEIRGQPLQHFIA